MTILTSTPRMKAFVLSEGEGTISRENVVVTQSGTALESGTVLAQAGDAGAMTSAATAGNTGNPTFGAFTVGAAAVPGDYKLTFTAATKFAVENPNGVTVGNGTTGVAFSKGGLGFTLTAGGTAAVAGDEFTLTVAAGTGKYVAYTAGGAAGPAAGILYNYLPAATGDVKAVAFTRLCEVNGSEVTGLDAGATINLAARNIVVRTAIGLSGTY